RGGLDRARPGCQSRRVGTRPEWVPDRGGGSGQCAQPASGGQSRAECPTRHLADAESALRERGMPRSRLSCDEAMTLWQARDVYRVHALFRGLVLVFFSLEFLLLSSRGYWYLGLIL